MDALMERMAVASHEAVHCLLAYILGFHVDDVTIDRLFLDNGSAGGTWFIVKKGDARPAELKAMCRAMTYLGPVLHERRLPVNRSDNDVRRAGAIISDYGLDDGLVSAQLYDLLRTEAVRRGVAWVEVELFDRRTMSGTEVHELLDERLASWRDEIFAKTAGIVRAVEDDVPNIARRLVEHGSERDLLARLAALETE